MTNIGGQILSTKLRAGFEPFAMLEDKLCEGSPAIKRKTEILHCAALCSERQNGLFIYYLRLVMGLLFET